MTLSEIENRIDSIVKELEVLKTKENELEQIDRKKKLTESKQKDNSTIRYSSYQAAVKRYIIEYSHIYFSPEESELNDIRSKIYKLREELNDLSRQRLEIKRKDEINYKFKNCFIDDKYLLSFLKDNNIQYVTITFIDKYSVNIKCPDSTIIGFVTGKGISADLAVGQLLTI